MITLEPRDDQTHAIWQALIDLGRHQPRGWTLIGAQMVALHAAEHNRAGPRSSRDADVLVNVRLVQDGTQLLSRTLMQLGFQFLGAGPEGIGHRFRRGPAEIDILAPDGLGRRTELTTLPPARTVSVPGGAQALARTEIVDVSIAGDAGIIPRPNLLGAILLKCRAIDVDDAPNSQRLDLASLLSLANNPRVLATDVTLNERRWLRRRTDLLNPEAPAWRSLGHEAETAHSALRILAGV